MNWCLAVVARDLVLASLSVHWGKVIDHLHRVTCWVSHWGMVGHLLVHGLSVLRLTVLGLLIHFKDLMCSVKKNYYKTQN